MLHTALKGRNVSRHVSGGPRLCICTATRDTAEMEVAERGEVVRRIAERTNLDGFADRLLTRSGTAPSSSAFTPRATPFVRGCDGTWSWSPAGWSRAGRPASRSSRCSASTRAPARPRESLPTCTRQLQSGARFAAGAAGGSDRGGAPGAAGERGPAVRIRGSRIDDLSRGLQRGRRAPRRHRRGSRGEGIAAEITADETPRPEDHQLAERIEFHLERAARPFVVASPKGTVEFHAELAAALRRRRALAVSEGRRVVGLSYGPGQLEGLSSAGAPSSRRDRPRSVSSAATAWTSCATPSISPSRGDSGTIAADDYLAELMVRRSPRIAARIAQRLYGRSEPSCAHPRRPDRDNFERARSAAALPVHRNTLRDRISRISELTGVDLESTRPGATAYRRMERRHRHALTARVYPRLSLVLRVR